MPNSPCSNGFCPREEETKRILGELAILVDGIRLYLREMRVEDAPLRVG